MFAPSTPRPEAEALAQQLAHDLPSPYCPGRSIASCPSGSARALEDNILEQALAGQGREEIEASLVARFGREKMGYEQSNALFVVVTLIALAAVAFIFTAGRRWAKRGRSESVPAAAGSAGSAGGLSQDELDDLEDELDALDGI